MSQSIDVLSAKYNLFINHEINEEQKNQLIIQAVRNSLSKTLDYPEENHTENTGEFTHRVLKDLMFAMVVASGLFRQAMSSYLSGITLLGLIPGLSLDTLIISALIYTTLDSILYYALVVAMIKSFFKLPNSTNERAQLITLYEKEIKDVLHIHFLLGLNPNTDLAERDGYSKIRDRFAEDLKRKLDGFIYEEDWFVNILKVIVITFGLFSKIAGSYFMAKSLLLQISPLLIGTPLGYGFLLLTIVTNLVFFYSMGSMSIENLVNPNKEAQDKLNKSFETFVAKINFFQQHEKSVSQPSDHPLIKKKATNDDSHQGAIPESINP